MQVQDIEFVVNMVSPIPKFLIKNSDTKMFTGSNKEFQISFLQIVKSNRVGFFLTGKKRNSFVTKKSELVFGSGEQVILNIYGVC